MLGCFAEPGEAGGGHFGDHVHLADLEGSLGGVLVAVAG